MIRRIAVATLAALAVLVPATPAPADHELWFRYTVLGYVKDARGRPLARRSVAVIRDKTGLGYPGETDETGLYLIVTRLADESAGEALTVRIGGATTRVIVRFDAANHDDERGTRVDSEGGRVIERRAWFPSTLARVMAPTAR